MTAARSAPQPSGREGRKGGRRWAAYRRANWLLTGAGITLALAGVPPGSPEVQAIRRALRAVNQASGLDRERKEVPHPPQSGGPHIGKPPAA
jgi:hypothetical protein